MALAPEGSYADAVSLSASRDNKKARETRLGGALRCVSFVLLFFLVRSLSRAANLTGFYRMCGYHQPYLNVQAVASSGPVCAFQDFADTRP